MRLVLLSGGSGKRLWPLSNDSRSKQFLKVLDDNRGHLESMVQRVWGQLEAVGLTNSTLIATTKAQTDMIQNQLNSNIPLIIEPERRDTFPAVSLAAVYLYSVAEIDLDEVVVVLPVDPYVDVDFFYKIKELEHTIHSTNADIALIGVEPSIPSEKYGYIIPEKGEKGNAVIKVSHFKEKPAESQAIQLIQNKALWNCGVFAFKLSYVINLLTSMKISVQYETLLEQYNQLPKISFDYEVVEKANHVMALVYSGFWKDLGTWNTLTEEIVSPLIGKGVIGGNVRNTHIINELGIPIVVEGLSDVVVASSPDGILVANKASSHKIKELVSEFDDKPMYEERKWGWYRILDYVKFPGGKEVLTKRVGIKAGSNLSYQFHCKRNEVWTIISGNGEVALNDKIFEVNPGDVVQIPAQSKHGIKATINLELIEVQTGSELIEEDIIHVYKSWEEVFLHCKRMNEIAATPSTKERKSR